MAVVSANTGQSHDDHAIWQRGNQTKEGKMEKKHQITNKSQL